jgi:hypothetical protein
MSQASDNYFLSLQTAKNASDAVTIFNESTRAKAEIPEIDRAPTAGKSIPIVVGAVKMTGDVIWIRTFKNSKNECRADVALCFGRNMFGRAIGLVSLSQGGNYIYRRSGGATVDPPKAVRFYDGTQTTADPKIVSYEGASKTPAFEGYIYAVLENVKLGDISAEFSDQTIEQSVSTSLACDPALAGIDLQYDPSTGLYYGLEDPMSGASYIIVSDGCRIIKRTAVQTPFASEYEPPIVQPEPFYVDSLYPLRCEGLVVLNGFSTYDGTAGVSPDWYGGSWSPVFDPWTGRMIHKALYFGDSQTPFNYLGSATIWRDTSPPATEIDWLDSYKLPGEYARVAYIRLFDPSDAVAAQPDFGIPLVTDDYPATLNAGNICCHVVQVTTGQVWFDYSLARTNISPYRPYLTAWNTRGSPLVDDVMFCKSNFSSVTLVGVKHNAGSFTVYVIEHSSGGMAVTVTETVTLPTDWTSDNLNYDPATETILVDASPPIGSLTSPRLYLISLGGSSSYQIMGNGYTKMVPRPNGKPANGKAPVQNNNASQIGSMDLDTGSITELYNGAAPTGTPVVDLNRQTFSLPTVEGVTTYAANQVAAEEIPLTSILTDCCAIKGYNSADLVFQNLSTFSVLGLLINSTIRLTDLFNRLGTVFGFTFVETDRKLKFLRKRSGGSIAIDVSLTEDDLVRPDNEDSPIREIQRASANNLLGGMDLEFMNPLKLYENDTLRVRRPVGSYDTGASSRLETLSIPVAMDPDLAYSLVYEAFYSLIRKETRVSFVVPSWHARIEPGDCVSVTVDGVTTIGIAVRVTMREDFAQEVELESYIENGETNTGSVTANTPEITVPQLIYGDYIHINLRSYLSRDDVGGLSKVMLYAALSADGAEQWSGADLYRSSESGYYTKILEYNLPPIAAARAVNVPADPPLLFATDDINYLHIMPYSGSSAEFSSQTYLQQMNGNKIAAYGRPGRWELISWRDVAEQSDGSLILTNLQRGLYGTHREYATFENGGDNIPHLVGDIVCILDSVRLIKMQRLASEVGFSDRYAVATDSVGVDTARKVWGTVTGRQNQIPPIMNLRAIHVPGETTMKITWDQMSPVAGGWPDNGAENPVLEAVLYAIDIYGWSGNYNFTTTDREFIWEGYGDDAGAYGNAEQFEIYIVVTAYSATYPNEFPFDGVVFGEVYAREG